MEKKAIDDFLGGFVYFDNIEDRSWEDIEYWSQKCRQCGEIRKESTHIDICIRPKSLLVKEEVYTITPEQEAYYDALDKQWQKDYEVQNKKHIRDVDRWLKERYQ